MSDVIDLGEERERRSVEELVDMARNFNPTYPRIDLRQKKLHIAPMSAGRGGSSDWVSFVFYDTEEGFGNPVGSLLISREQWEDLQKKGEVFLRFPIPKSPENNV